MRFVKTVSCKALHQVKNFVGFVRGNVVTRSTFAENFTVLGHFFGLLFTHGTA